MRYELTDYEWAAIKPMLPNKPRGVQRVDDRTTGSRPNHLAFVQLASIRLWLRFNEATP